MPTTQASRPGVTTTGGPAATAGAPIVAVPTVAQAIEAQAHKAKASSAAHAPAVPKAGPIVLLAPEAAPQRAHGAISQGVLRVPEDRAIKPGPATDARNVLPISAPRLRGPRKS